MRPLLAHTTVQHKLPTTWCSKLKNPTSIYGPIQAAVGIYRELEGDVGGGGIGGHITDIARTLH